MPLVVSDLEAALLRVHTSPPRKLNKTLDQLTDAYVNYAQLALTQPPAPPVPPTFVGTEKTVFKGALQVAFKQPKNGNPGLAASQWDQAILLFWSATVPATLFVGSTLLVYVPGILTAALTTVFSNTANTAQTAAFGMASAIDAATRSITVTFPGPLAGTLG